MLTNNNALSAKAKAMYGRRLTVEDYEELLHKRNVSEIAAYLKNQTKYSEVLSDVKENSVHRGQLEIMLKRDSFNRRNKLYRYADKSHQEFYNMSSEKEEIAQILACLRALISNDYSNFVSDLPLFMNKSMSIDMRDLLSVKSVKDLVKVIKHTAYYGDIAEYLEAEDIHYATIEHTLNLYYYRHLNEVVEKHFKGDSRKEILKIVNQSIELKNIAKIYRMKEYYHSPPERVRNGMLDCKPQISKQLYEQLFDAKDGTKVLQLLEQTPYKIKVGNEDFVFIEQYARQINYDSGHRLMNFSTDPSVVYLAYFLLEESEVENLINIIEGVRYGVVASQIQKLLIY